MARSFLRNFFSRTTRRRACKIASVVAPILLILNHGDLLLRAPLSGVVACHLALNFLVPYVVASYSAAHTAAEALSLEEGRQ